MFETGLIPVHQQYKMVVTVELTRLQAEQTLIDLVISRKTVTFQNNKIALVFAALILLCVCGCVDTDESAGTFRATYSWWVGTAAIIGGLALAIVGWLWKQTSFRGWVLFIFALAGTIGLAPFGFVDQVTVTEERLQTKWGFWMAPTLHDIAFDDVAGVNLTKEITRGRRGRKDVKYNLVFRMKNGEADELTATNALMKAALESIAGRLADRGVFVNNLTGE